MKKRKFVVLIFSLFILAFFTGCNLLGGDVETEQDMENTIKSYWLQVDEVVSSYYPEIQLTPSHDNVKSSDNGFFYDYEYNLTTPYNVGLKIEIIYDYESERHYKLYCVEMTRDFECISENGFNENDLNLFCDLSSIVSDDGLSKKACKSVMSDNKKYSVKYDQDDFTPVDNEFRVSGYYLYYDITDYESGNWEQGGYGEKLRSEFQIDETFWNSIK